MKTAATVYQEDPSSTRKAFWPFAAYLLLFFAVWTLWVYAGYPLLTKLDDTTLLYAIVNLTIRFLIWILPVFLYLYLVDHVNPFEYLKLRRYWVRGIIVGLVLSVINFLGTLLRYGPPHLSMQAVTWNSILGTSILIGFIEEIPFRGFILQKFQERSSFWLANLFSSLLFLAIHLPGWILLHQLNFLEALTIFLLGAIFAAAFYYSKSLWSSIVAHSFNDFLTAVLFRI